MKNSCERVVEPELLDELPPQDRRAMRSRLDLRRLNAWMNHSQLMARTLSENLNGSSLPRIAEIGAGDGHFFLTVAKVLRTQWPQAGITFVDRLNAFDMTAIEQLNQSGWHAHTEIATASEWLQKSAGAFDAIIANLFLHQFKTDELTAMLQSAARSTKIFVALEPRRAWLPRICGRFLWAIGCSPVTRNDANISIRAGFSGHELSDLWPKQKNWQLTERPVGLFSHLFVARRKD
jgi:hypothetical protein